MADWKPLWLLEPEITCFSIWRTTGQGKKVKQLNHRGYAFRAEFLMMV
jgi:hypothetical protein